MLSNEKINDLFGYSENIHLVDIVHQIVSFQNTSKEHIANLNKWLKDHSCKYKMEKVIMYHGTSSKNNLLEEGILKTTIRSKRSLQSATGFVYLSLYPESALNFAKMGYPYDNVSVYAVAVNILDLLPDHDQLKNKRLWGGFDTNTVGKTLADSLVYGSGARVKKNIEPWQVRNIDKLLQQ